jgi:hypothetical protein
MVSASQVSGLVNFFFWGPLETFNSAALSWFGETSNGFTFFELDRYVFGACIKLLRRPIYSICGYIVALLCTTYVLEGRMLDEVPLLGLRVPCMWRIINPNLEI